MRSQRQRESGDGGQNRGLLRDLCASVGKQFFPILSRIALIGIVVSLPGGLFSGCAHAPATKATGYDQSAGDRAVVTALAMIGRPYKFRGDTPSGFDCSGLVRYSYLTAGRELPHGTSALLKVTRSVGLSNAQKGDLLFFDQSGKKYSHVGIYIGSDECVHAPATGGAVRRESMTDPYWKKHYLDTRRLL